MPFLNTGVGLGINQSTLPQRLLSPRFHAFDVFSSCIAIHAHFFISCFVLAYARQQLSGAFLLFPHFYTTYPITVNVLTKPLFERRMYPQLVPSDQYN